MSLFLDGLHYNFPELLFEVWLFFCKTWLCVLPTEKLLYIINAQHLILKLDFYKETVEKNNSK